MKPCAAYHPEPVEGCRICHLYETHPGYRARWGGTELLEGEPSKPRPKNPRRKGLGDRVAAWITWLTFGAVKPCGGCLKRKAWLNRQGWRVLRWLNRF